MPDLESETFAVERNITKKAELKNQRFDEIAKKEKKISVELFERYFDYSSPSYISLNKTENLEEVNRALVNIIENRLTNLIKEVKSNSISDTKKIKNRINMVEIIELNQQNQSGQGLNILTPNQILSRLPITLAQ